MYDPEFFRKPGGPFTAEVLASASAHACSEAPKEACGVVVNGEYIACENVAADPLNQFEISPSVFAPLIVDGTLQGVIHSHPEGPWWPSKHDMASQINTAVPWAILVPGEAGAQLACWWGGERPVVFTPEGLHVPRSFLHGVSDCYSMAQDYYREVHGLDLGHFPRAWEWWKDPDTHGSLYLDNLEAQGFEVVSTDPGSFAALAQPGDAYLMQIRSRVPNHAGVYLGGGLLLEHIQGNLSHREPIARKLKHITHWLRHKG